MNSDSFGQRLLERLVKNWSKIGWRLLEDCSKIVRRLLEDCSKIDWRLLEDCSKIAQRLLKDCLKCWKTFVARNPEVFCSDSTLNLIQSYNKPWNGRYFYSFLVGCCTKMHKKKLGINVKLIHGLLDCLERRAQTYFSPSSPTHTITSARSFSTNENELLWLSSEI